jgi:hypothetical protein
MNNLKSIAIKKKGRIPQNQKCIDIGVKGSQNRKAYYEFKNQS